MIKTREKLKKLVFFTFLFFSVGFSLLALGQRIIKPKAGGGPIALFFVPSLEKIAPGAFFDLVITANPNNATFNAFELHFTFDNTKVELSAQDTANFSSNFDKLYSSSLGLVPKLEGNKIILSGAKTGEPFSGASDIPLVKVKMKAKAGIFGSALFHWLPETEVEGKALTKNDKEIIIGVIGGQAKLTFSSAKQNYVPGENLDLDLFLSTPSEVNSVQFEFLYHEILTFQKESGGDLSVENIVLNPNSGFDINNSLNAIDPKARKVRVGLVTTGKVSGEKKLATVRFKVKENWNIDALPVLNFQASEESRVYNLNTQNILTDRPVYSVSLSSSSLITPTIVGCNQFCLNYNLRCAEGLECRGFGMPGDSVCRNPVCPNNPSCICDNLTPSPPPGIPKITFKARLAHLQNYPELYLRLRVKDELKFMESTRSGQTLGWAAQAQNPPNTFKLPIGKKEVLSFAVYAQNSIDSYKIPIGQKDSLSIIIGEENFTYNGVTCLPKDGEIDFYVPVKADTNGLYRPVTSIGISPPQDAPLASVDSEGWITLAGIFPERYYSFFLKGPKTRASKMAEHIFLKDGQPESQNFSWENEPLEPGDLPDPNDGGRQNCTVNSIDISLMTARLGRTDNTSLAIADVNYDGVVNGNDISKVVNTLSTKPDDDTI